MSFTVPVQPAFPLPGAPLSLRGKALCSAKTGIPGLGLPSLPIHDSGDHSVGTSVPSNLHKYLIYPPYKPLKSRELSHFMDEETQVPRS